MVPEAAEADGSGAQERRTDGEAARESAIARRLAEMPGSCRRTYRKATRGEASPRMAIKSFCMQCRGWQRQEVALCTARACPLWMYRPFIQDDGHGDPARR